MRGERQRAGCGCPRNFDVDRAGVGQGDGPGAGAADGEGRGVAGGIGQFLLESLVNSDGAKYLSCGGKCVGADERRLRHFIRSESRDRRNLCDQEIVCRGDSGGDKGECEGFALPTGNMHRTILCRGHIQRNSRGIHQAAFRQENVDGDVSVGRGVSSIGERDHHRPLVSRQKLSRQGHRAERWNEQWRFIAGGQDRLREGSRCRGGIVAVAGIGSRDLLDAHPGGSGG